MIQTLDELKLTCLGCRRCELSGTRTNVVFGSGCETAKIMMIGEGPGEQEDKQGLAFVGRSGKLLDILLEAIGMSRRSDVYIANIVKCRPPGNRDPQAVEVERCISYLRNQVYLLRPRMIICLGRISAQQILDKSFRVTQQHGQWIEKNGVHMMGTFHPSALLRNPDNKPAAFEDFLAIRRKAAELWPERYGGL